MIRKRTEPAGPHSAAVEALRGDPRWGDWRWQLRHAARDPQALAAWFRAPLPRAALGPAGTVYPMAVPPYYASLVRRPAFSDPIFRMCAPDAAELVTGTAELEDDPFGEDAHMPAPGLIRRYRDRALVMATRVCASYCRHCTRKASMGPGRWGAGDGAPDLPRIAAYLRAHPEIREVLVSGGDPLMLSTARLEAILRAVRAAPNIEIVRLGTRMPVTLPQRVTPELVRMLRRHHPLWLNTHFNHAAELSPEAAAACARLADAGIPLGNQTVLLRGVNDRAAALEDLFRGLLRIRVRPYYLLQCDPVRGVGHFRVPLRRGLTLIDGLRRRLTGLAVPTFVVDVPAGGGKVPLLATGVERWGRGGAWLRGPGGILVRYPEPGGGLNRGDGRV